MNKRGLLLTVLCSVLLIALCVGGLELSVSLLPDHKGVTEEIDLPDDQSMLMVRDRASSTLYPWDIYENAAVHPIKSSEYEDIYPDKSFVQLIEILSPQALISAADKVAWNDRMQYVDNDGELIFFLKDVELSDEFGDDYLVNIAFTDARILYYACDRLSSEPQESAELTVGYEGYEQLNRDYLTFKDLYRNAAAGEWNVADEYEAEDNAALDSALLDNCFVLFLQQLSTAESARADWIGYDLEPYDFEYGYASLFQTLIADPSASGVVYRHSDQSPETVDVEFTSGERKLVLFYDLYDFSITGFSLEL